MRAAASLSYYGAFHFAGEKLEQLTGSSPIPLLGLVYPKTIDACVTWGRYTVPNIGYAIAELLFYAHELRKKADYDLHLVFTPEDKVEILRFVAQVLLAVRQVR